MLFQVPESSRPFPELLLPQNIQMCESKGLIKGRTGEWTKKRGTEILVKLSGPAD
jgi:hypothetical protein